MAIKEILYPIGRLVKGSVTRGDDTDAKGNKKVIKTGANAGQPAFTFSFAVAYAKGAEQSWTQTAWGAAIYQAGVEGYPNGETQHPTFAWKVIDGDSTIPNRSGNKPCDQEGYKGHWVIWFSSMAAPKLYDIIGNKVGDPPRALAPGMEILAGYYVQVFGTVVDNKPSESPGVYVNHSLVALAGYGERITQGPDANAVGFGAAALPAGASTVPVGMSMTPPAALPGAVQAPPAALPGAAVQHLPVQHVAHIAPPAAMQQVTLQPNPAILANPAAAAIAAPPPVAQIAPPPPPAPAADPMGAPPGRRMLGAYTYQALQAANYSDEQMIAQGFMA